MPLGFNLMLSPSEKVDGGVPCYFRKLLANVEVPCPKAVSQFSENPE